MNKDVKIDVVVNLYGISTNEIRFIFIDRSTIFITMNSFKQQQQCQVDHYLLRQRLSNYSSEVIISKIQTGKLKIDLL